MSDNVGNFDDVSYDQDGNPIEPPPRRGPGRPPKTFYESNGITPPYTGKPGRPPKVDAVDESGPLTDDVGVILPLFNAQFKRAVMSLRVIRIEPNEGHLGVIDNPHASEADIQERWGGGTFRVQALGENGAVLRMNTLKIAGDPIFQSQAIKRQWERMHGFKNTEQQTQQFSNFPQAAPGGGIDIKEIFMMMTEKENMRADSEARLAERQRQLQIEADDRRRKDEYERETRRKQDEEERERRQSQQRRDDLERDRENTRQTMALIQASHAQSMQFMQAQMQLQSAKPQGEGGLLEAIKTIAVIKETFANNDGGGGNADAEETVMQSLIKNGPAWLNAAGTAITGVVGEIKNGPNNVQNPSQPQSILNSLPVEIQNKTEALVLKLMEKGLDPEIELNKVLDGVLQAAERLPQPGSPPTVQKTSQKPATQTVPQPVQEKSHDLSSKPVTRVPAPQPSRPDVEPNTSNVIPIKQPKNKTTVTQFPGGVGVKLVAKQ